MIYQVFTFKESKNSITLKIFISSSWNSSYQQQRLLKYRNITLSRTIKAWSTILKAELFDVFYMELVPINCKEQNHEDVQKMMDRLTSV